jgi:hypothetical protein
MNNATTEWEIGLAAWIIQDGNYDNFETGQTAEFALEFYSPNYKKSESHSKSCNRLGGAEYSIVGEVIYLRTDMWVLDFGLCAFQDSEPPEGIRVGDFIAAEISLGVDPYFYFETLYALPGIPPLIYSWKINAIDQQTAPFIESREPSGQKVLIRDGKVLIRDEKKLGYKPITKTDAWNDDGGHAEYVLTCAPLPNPPKFKSTTVR